MELFIRKKIPISIFFLMILFVSARSQNAAGPNDSLMEAYFAHGKYRELVKYSTPFLRENKGDNRLYFFRGLSQYELKNDADAICVFEKIDSSVYRNLSRSTYLLACKRMYRRADESYVPLTSKSKYHIDAGLLLGGSSWVASVAPPELKTLAGTGDVFLSANFPGSLRSLSVFPEISINRKLKVVAGYSYNRMQIHSGVWTLFGSNMRSYLWEQTGFYGLASLPMKNRWRGGVFFHRIQTSLGYLSANWNASNSTYTYSDGAASGKGAIFGFHLLHNHPYFLTEINPSALFFNQQVTLNLECTSVIYPLGNQRLILYPKLYLSSDTGQRRNLLYLGIGSMPVKNLWVKAGVLSGSIQNQVSMAGSVFSPVPDNTRYVWDGEIIFLAGKFKFNLAYQSMKRTLTLYGLNMPDSNRPDRLNFTSSSYSYRTQCITFGVKYQL